MGMEINHTKKIRSLKKDEINTLINLYYDTSLVEDEELLSSLVEKNLVSTQVEQNKNKLFLTDLGLNLCGTVMFDRIKQNKEKFEEKINSFSERGLSLLVNRIIYHNPVRNENGKVSPVNEPYSFDENFWYERVLLKSKRFTDLMDSFYGILEELDFVKNVNGEIYSSPEIEDFLKDRFKDVIDLTWSEEDSLKYYYFFCLYASDQKNLINFSGEGKIYRSMFFNEEKNASDFLFSNNNSDPRSLLYNLGLSEKRVISFLEEMEGKNIVTERYYPLSGFSFFNSEDKIFVIIDINEYMEFTKTKFLEPVVKSILKE